MKKKGKNSKPLQTATMAEIQPANRFLLVMITFSMLIIAAFIIQAYQRNSVYHDFISLWGDIAKTSPNKRRAHENLGQALSTVGRLDEALREFQTVMALPDDGSVPLRDLYREIGVVYFRMNRMEDAINAWQTGLRFAPYDSSLLNNLSIALMQTGRFDEAAAHAETALSSDPNLPQALNTMGQILLTKKKYNEAVTHFQRAVELQPDVPARYWNLALALEQAGKYDQALTYAQKYLEIESDGAARQRTMGFIEHLKKIMRR